MTCKPRQIIGSNPSPVILSDYNRYCRKLSGGFAANEIFLKSLFAPLLSGLWLEADLSVMFQDTDGLIPVTTVGQSTARVNDKSGFDNHSVQVSLGSEPIYQKDGDTPVLRFSSQSLQTLAAVDFSFTDKLTVYVVGSASSAASQNYIELTADTSTIDGGFAAFQGDGVSRHAQCFINGGGVFSYSEAGEAHSGINVAVHKIDKSLPTERTQSFLNGKDFTSTPLDAASVGNFANDILYIGSRAGTSSFLDGDINAILVFPGVIHDAVTTAKVESILSQRYSWEWLNQNEITDSKNESFADYVMTSALGRTKFNTSSLSVDVVSFSNIFSTYPQYAECYIMVDGLLHQKITHTVDGSRTDTVALPAGNKVVELVSGLTSKPITTVIGTFFVGADFGDSSKSVTEAGGGLVFYGDSITVGGNSVTPGTEAYLALVRVSAPYQVGAEAWGFRSLNDDAVDAPTRSAFIERLTSYNPSIIYLQIGTNDYGLNKWAASSFGVAYAATLDDIHSQFPNAIIYAQSPIVRASEVANGSGSTLQDYRDEISTAAGSRSWVEYIDGTSILLVSDLADGVHPTTSGHLKYATAIESILGI